MDIININNDTSKMKLELDKIIDDQNALKAEAEDVRSKRLNKVSELAQTLMAIENIENTLCTNGKGSGTKTTVKHAINSDKPLNFNDAVKRVAYAKL